mmetsp:Transcript_76584/g.123886  ORF Transcript_76584/g.123886 Transcript_76584/m.123886 type:complete len:115 (+) Transcript_76584:1344-1688(+)
MRVMLSSRLVKTGQEWVSLMKKSATGTYSSQGLAVDYNKFEAGNPVLPKGTFFVLEQAPGISHEQDMSKHLQEVGYWSSESRAWFKDVRDVSGDSDHEQLYKKTFSVLTKICAL